MPELLEKQPTKEKGEFSILDERRFRKFIREEDIDEDDFEIIEKLSESPPELFKEFVNFFDKQKEKNDLIRKLERQITILENKAQETSDEYSKAYLEKKTELRKLLLKMLDKYSSVTVNYLVMILKKNKKLNKNLRS